MKALHLFLFLFLLITLSSCRTSKDILKCAINNINPVLLESFLSMFKYNTDAAYGLLYANRNLFVDAINACL